MLKSSEDRLSRIFRSHFVQRPTSQDGGAGTNHKMRQPVPELQRNSRSVDVLRAPDLHRFNSERAATPEHFKGSTSGAGNALASNPTSAATTIRNDLNAPTKPLPQPPIRMASEEKFRRPSILEMRKEATRAKMKRDLHSGRSSVERSRNGDNANRSGQTTAGTSQSSAKSSTDGARYAQQRPATAANPETTARSSEDPSASMQQRPATVPSSTDVEPSKEGSESLDGLRGLELSRVHGVETQPSRTTSGMKLLPPIIYFQTDDPEARRASQELEEACYQEHMKNLQFQKLRWHVDRVTYEQKFEEYQHANWELSKHCQSLIHDNVAIQHESQKLQHEKKQLEEENMMLAETKQALKDSNEVLEQEHKTTIQENGRLVSDNDKLAEKVQKLEEEKAKFEHDKKELQHGVALHKAARDAVLMTNGKLGGLCPCGDKLTMRNSQIVNPGARDSQLIVPGGRSSMLSSSDGSQRASTRLEQSS